MNPRNTMGLIDPITKKRYPDIISAHLQARTLNMKEWLEDGGIREARDRHKMYKLLLDHNTLKALTMHGIIDVMVSFQIRTDGCFAVARLLKEKTIPKANPHYSDNTIGEQA